MKFIRRLIALRYLGRQIASLAEYKKRLEGEIAQLEKRKANAWLSEPAHAGATKYKINGRDVSPQEFERFVAGEMDRTALAAMQMLDDIFSTMPPPGSIVMTPEGPRTVMQNGHLDGCDCPKPMTQEDIKKFSDALDRDNGVGFIEALKNYGGDHAAKKPKKGPGSQAEE